MRARQILPREFTVSIGEFTVGCREEVQMSVVHMAEQLSLQVRSRLWPLAASWRIYCGRQANVHYLRVRLVWRGGRACCLSGNMNGLAIV